MKVKFDIECTPKEARLFFGLPDVEPMQTAVMKELETQMLENIRSLDPETMMKTWLPVTIQGWGEMQKMFWEQMGPLGAMGGMAASSDKKKSKKD